MSYPAPVTGLVKLNYHITLVFSFQNNSKYLDLSYKMDLDLWDCLGRVKLVFSFV